MSKEYGSMIIYCISNTRLPLKRFFSSNTLFTQANYNIVQKHFFHRFHVDVEHCSKLTIIFFVLFFSYNKSIFDYLLIINLLVTVFLQEFLQFQNQILKTFIKVFALTASLPSIYSVILHRFCRTFSKIKH